MRTVIHVTHETIHKLGGIGTVLQGLITAPSYQKEVGRTFLVGPLFDLSDEAVLAREGEVLYSSISGIRNGSSGSLLAPVEEKYGVRMVYGRRALSDPSNGARVKSEVLLVDVGEMISDRENAFKFALYEAFGLQSDRYEATWDYLQYVRLAEPAYEAMEALLGEEPGPHYVLAHEYMGMPMALKTILAGNPEFRSIFYAHEVATMRPIVEASPGHDTMFYNVLNEAMSQGLSVSDVFGDQSGFYRHALIECASYCDSIFAVGDPVVEELRFLGPAFADLPIELVYNGVPAFEVTPAEKKVSVRRMQDYTQELVGFVPDIVFTHVTRLVMSKGLWRDTLVLEHLDRRFSAEGLRGVYYILSSTGGTRSTEDVHRMEAEYGWPAVHREGYPDLVGPEVGLWQMIEDFNRRAQAIRVVFVNQFGWSQDRCGKRMPAEMGLMDLRKASHVEFGQSIYEPFGIAHVEPLSFGALCVVSSVCGCCGYVRRASGQEDFPNLVVADYTALPETQSLEEVLHIGKEARDRLEGQVTSVVAEKVMDLLPRTEKGSAAAVQRGYVVAHKMSWERVCQDLFLPALDRACHSSRVSKKER